VKPFVALALLAGVGFAATGCGATKKVVIVTNGGPIVRAGPPETTRTLAISGTVTVPDVKTGTRVSCKGWGGQGVRVPPRGESLEGFAARLAIPGKKSVAADQMSLQHRQNGSIAVTCKPSH
jgi:hypothetical protein